MKNRFIAILQNMSHVPSGAIYRGGGKVDFEVDTADIDAHLEQVKEVFVRFNDSGDELFRKPGFVDQIPDRPARGPQ
jgi:hypothetical protein